MISWGQTMAIRREASVIPGSFTKGTLGTEDLTDHEGSFRSSFGSTLASYLGLVALSDLCSVELRNRRIHRNVSAFCSPGPQL